MAGRLAGRVAFITGSGMGIGREAAVLFAEEGAGVVVADIDAKAAKETVALVERRGGGGPPPPRGGADGTDGPPAVGGGEPPCCLREPHPNKDGAAGEERDAARESSC